MDSVVRSPPPTDNLVTIMYQYLLIVISIFVPELPLQLKLVLHLKFYIHNNYISARVTVNAVIMFTVFLSQYFKKFPNPIVKLKDRF